MQTIVEYSIINIRQCNFRGEIYNGLLASARKALLLTSAHLKEAKMRNKVEPVGRELAFQERGPGSVAASTLCLLSQFVVYFTLIRFSTDTNLIFPS